MTFPVAMVLRTDKILWIFHVRIFLFVVSI